MTKALRAADLAKLLGTSILDAEDAAAYLGITRTGVEYAAHRGRLPHVQYGAKKLFARADLEDYVAHRGRGRGSQLRTVEGIQAKVALANVIKPNSP